MNNEQEKLMSYKLSVDIHLNFNEIVKYCFPNLKTTKETDEFIDTLRDQFKIRNTRCLKTFYRFLEIHDGASGLSTVYEEDCYKNPESGSNCHLLPQCNKIEDIKIVGYILGQQSNDLSKKFPNNKIGQQVVIRADRIEFVNNDNNYHIKDLEDLNKRNTCGSLGVTDDDIVKAKTQENHLSGHDHVSYIPLSEIISFLKRLEKSSHLDGKVKKYGYSSENIIKKFPKELEKTLTENEAEYLPFIEENFEDISFIKDKLTTIKTNLLLPKEQDTELYNRTQENGFKSFQTPYFELRMKLKFFYPDKII